MTDLDIEQMAKDYRCTACLHGLILALGLNEIEIVIPIEMELVIERPRRAGYINIK